MVYGNARFELLRVLVFQVSAGALTNSSHASQGGEGGVRVIEQCKLVTPLVLNEAS